MLQKNQILKNRFVEVLGIRVHLLYGGSGRPALFLHGLVGSSENWRGTLTALAPQAGVYAIDQANMGRSQRIRGLDQSLEATADRVSAIMEALGLAQADIVGHSHGGAVALMVAARHPERVRTLVLFAPANPYSRVGDSLVRIYSTSLGRWTASVAPYLPKRLQRVGLERMFGDPARIQANGLDAYLIGLRVPGTMRHILDIVRGWFVDIAKLEAVLPDVVHVPPLLVWGDRDRAVTPASIVPLRRALPQSELRVVSGAGHVVFEEMPEETNRILLEWLGREHASDLPTAPGSSSKATAREGPESVPVPARGEARHK